MHRIELIDPQAGFMSDETFIVALTVEIVPS
jgi:hypothetical protein